MVTSPVISIHAPTRGATVCCCLPLLHLVQFQSTLPHGERRVASSLIVLAGDFNPRSHTGSDPLRHQNGPCPRRFQSTLPHGERLKITTSKTNCWKEFQSTLPHGERLDDTYLDCIKYRISIHAPTRGATVRDHFGCIHYDISIHAPTRGAT